MICRFFEEKNEAKIEYLSTRLTKVTIFERIQLKAHGFKKVKKVRIFLGYAIAERASEPRKKWDEENEIMVRTKSYYLDS